MMDTPEQLATRPQSKGLPIPFTAFVDDAGVPDFKVTDQGRWKEAVTKRLCALCGTPLGYWIFFVGGPMTVEKRLYYDPPMHEDCARFALEACPFLAGKKDYATHVKERDGVEIREDQHVSPRRPERIALYRTRGFRLAEFRGNVYVKADPPKSVEWLDSTSDAP